MLKRTLGFFIVLALLIAVIGTPTITQPVEAQDDMFSVAIIVVDEFSTVDENTIRDLNFEDGENCAVSIHGQGYVSMGASAENVDELHGNVVISQFEDLLSEYELEDSVSLHSVDIASLTTTSISDGIQAVIDDAQADYYVVNMSFVLLPCEHAGNAKSLQAQLSAARGQGDNAGRGQAFDDSVSFLTETVIPAASQSFEDIADDENIDALQSLLSDLGSQAVLVAAAGNFGLDFPLWPAAWENVISVSASNGADMLTADSWDSDDDTPLLSVELQRGNSNQFDTERVSNYGEVMMPGEYDHADLGTIIGTSFAAPRLSVIMAWYLSQVGNGHCQADDGSSALAYDKILNLTLNEAIAEHCSGLGDYLP